MNDLDTLEFDPIDNIGSLDEKLEDILTACHNAESRRQRFVIAVDATGSMQPIWNQAIDAVKKAIDGIKTRSQVPIAIKIVAYRDHIYDTKPVEQSEWSDDSDYLKSFIQDMFCFGGGDFPESVGHGLRPAIEGRANQVILIGDAEGRPDSEGYQEASTLGQMQCPVYALYLSDRPELVQNFTRIAKLSGGRAFYLRSLGDMDQIFQVLLAANKALQIEYQPTSQQALELQEVLK